MKVKRCLYCRFEGLMRVAQRSDLIDILECGRCSLMMVSEISNNTANMYGEQYFEKNSESGSGYINYLSSPAANLIGKYAFARLFAKNPGTHVDLGSANGSLLEIFENEGFDSLGLEISREAVGIAKNKGLNSVISDLKNFSKDTPKASLITAFDLIEHIDSPKNVLSEVYAALKTDGYFIFSTLSVDKDNPKDYWFSHSLEHYLYYNRHNLDYILKDIFGEGTYHFEEASINGINEFWGVAKKGKLNWEKKLLVSTFSNNLNTNDSNETYLVCLFYNQLSRFSESNILIDKYSRIWRKDQEFLARFLNLFYQGKFETAIEFAQDYNKQTPLSNTLYWQALSYILSELAKIKEEVVIKEYTKELLALREEVFRLKDELKSLKNSRVLGKIIKLREFVGAARKKVIISPRTIFHKTRVVTAPFIPGPIRRSIKKTAKSILHKETTIRYYKNDKWNHGPLVSIVIPYYNRADTIDETLASLENQTFTEFETTLVNDGSTEPGSIQKLKELDKRYKKVGIVHQQNSGVAAARNNGIKESNGKYIICLDSDDALDPTFIEKCTILLETNPDVALATTYMESFGVVNEPYLHAEYDPLEIMRNNMVITAAQYRKEAWRKVGGYKSGIGYEDWEFWVNLAENGYWGKLIPEALFKYRTAMQSRYVEDKDVHWSNLKALRTLHPNFRREVKRLRSRRQYTKNYTEPTSALINMDRSLDYKQNTNGKPNVLIATPWMTFGGAETLIINFCEEIKNNFNLSFITGLESEHEWEHKFKQITERVYHLRNLFEDPALDIEFISNYIKTRNIDILHIIHTSFAFELLPEIKNRHPSVKVLVTVFNDRAEHFNNSVKFEANIDSFSTDNNAVSEHYRKKLESDRKIITIPNGINSNDIYNPVLYDRAIERSALNLADTDLAVFFIGRLAEEKNVDIFLEVGRRVAHTNKNIKFFVIGDGNLRPAVEKQVKSIGSHNVQYLGYQSEIAKYLSAADIFVLPSSIEGFPLSILEAMAMKVAVVASDVGAVSDIIESGEDGLIVTPGSADEIEAAIQKLSADAKLLEKIKLNARKKIDKKYSNTVLGTNYKKLYRELLT